MSGNKNKISVGVVGARGYTGAETLRILLNHPCVSEIVAFKTSGEEEEVEKTGKEKEEGEKLISEFIPSFRKLRKKIYVSRFEEREVGKLDVVFLCVSHGKAYELVSRIIETSSPPPFIVDLSADFRFSNPKTYEKVYGKKNPILEKETGEKEKRELRVVYGLTELVRDKVKSSEIVGNPGCYPTAFLLGVAPIFRVEGVRDKIESFIIDAKSGTTGAGRKALPHLTYGYLSENIKVYAWIEHRHVPEMKEKAKEFLGLQEEPDISFCAQLIPAKRGILETIWIRFKTPPDKRKIFEEYERFADENFFFDFWGDKFPDIYSVVGTNFVRVGIKMEGKTAMVVSVIDNLVKGASGQAIQNMNVKFGFDEKAGLENLTPHFI